VRAPPRGSCRRLRTSCGAIESTYKIPESVDGALGRLPAALDQVATRIAHLTAQFHSVVVERLGEELRTFRGPIFVAGENVGYAKIEEAAHPLQILGRSEPYIGLVGRRTTAGVEDDPGILKLDGFSPLTILPPRMPA
jgi:hypothetical protein